MLTINMFDDQILRLVIGGKTIRLKLQDGRIKRARIGIEAPDDCEIERVKIHSQDRYTRLEALDVHTGTQIGGRGGKPDKEKESRS